MADDNENHFIKIAAKCEHRSVICYFATRSKEPIKNQKLCRGYDNNTMFELLSGSGSKSSKKVARMYMMNLTADVRDVLMQQVNI